ncbi:N-acetyltransferase [Bacillus sp. FJAT-29814]|uniref:GNAT family N-acetyltransferase n=1 Tax=Bacillus sp. FJAT-29814 TaxID=1729688 RepID=UPI000AF76858|nr:GNAT family N-acetyltransferase [Bacillus sp. FJAT-29814]
MKKVVLKSVEQDHRKLYMEWLLLADESEEIVKGYINDGEMFSVLYEGQAAGVILFTFHPGHMVEVKNMALAENFRGMGLGKMILQEAFEIYRAQGMQKMIVGTANSSIANLAFYQKVGFRMSEIKKDFFKKYPEPIYEYGIRALDMVMFEKSLQD